MIGTIEMKSLLSLGLCSIAVSFAMSTAMAESVTSKKMVRNDRVTINLAKVNYDFDTTANFKRIARNDHIVFTKPTNQVDSLAVKKKRVMRNDHVIFYK